MENLNLLRRTFTFAQKRLPALGAMLVGWITLLSWVITSVATRFSAFTGEGGMILMVFLPFLITGTLFSGFVLDLLHVDGSKYPALGMLMSAIMSILINSLIMWAALTIIVALFRAFRRKTG